MDAAIQVLLGGIFQGAVFALVAIGFVLIYRVTGVLNLSQGGFVVVGALTFFSLEQGAHWPLWAAFIAAIVLCGAIGAILERLVLRNAVDQLPTSSLLILTAGLLTVFEGATLLIWGVQPYSVPSFSGERPVTILGINVATQDFWIAAVTIVVMAGLWYVLTATTFGRALRACAENPVAASLVGINVPRVRLLAFAVGAALGALGGIVLAPITTIQFDTGGFFTNTGFIAVALGGMGSFPGAVLGGVGLGVVEQIAASFSSLYANALAFALLLGVLIWRPLGILGRASGREDTGGPGPRIGMAVRLRGRGGLLFLAVVALVIAVLPAVLDSSATQSLAIVGLLFISVMGLDVLMGFTGQVSLGHAGFMAIGGYTAAYLATRQHLPPLLALLVGLVFSLIVALLLAAATARLRGLYMALATLAFGLLVDSLTVGVASITGGPSGLVGVPPFSLGGWVFRGTSLYYLVWVVVAALFAVAFCLTQGDYGRSLQAIRGDQTAARALGIPVTRYKTFALLISAAYASIAGSLYAFTFNFLSPEMVNSARSLELVTMLVVGGQATLVGPLLGTALLTLLPTWVQALASFKVLGEGLLLVVVLLYAPGGLFGLASAVVARVRPAAAQPAQPRAKAADA